MFFFVVIHLLGAVTAALAFPHTTHGGAKSFSVRQVRNDKYGRKNGPAEYIKAHRKWGAELPGPLSRLVKGAVPAWNQTNDREYLSPVLLGSPPQMTYIDIDTGSADLWVFTSNTIAGSSGVNGGRRIYHPDKSSSAGMVINGTWDIMYGDGSFATGNIYHDVVTLGGITVANASVQEALAVSASMMIDPAMSGIMGLSINHSSTCSPPQPTMLDHLSAVLDQKVFAVDLRAGAVGEYHFGYANASAYQGDVSWRDLVPGSSFWQFSLDGVRVGSDKVRLRHGWRVVADTGTTLMLLPPDLVARYWAAVPGARLDPYWAGYLFPCNASASLPDLEFSFADGFVVAVPGRYLDFENVQADDCYGGLQNMFDGADFGILGDTWLKTMYVIFDVENRRLGLAKKKLLA